MSVDLTVEGAVARVTIDRPQVANAIDRRTTAELRATWSRLENDARVRVVVVTGAGERAFCAGADLRAEADCIGVPGDGYADALHPDGFGGIATNDHLLKPVIARVNGDCLGGGLELLLGCDVAIAVNSARFGFPEARFGQLPLDGGMLMLPRRIAYRDAMGLLLTGRQIDATEALRIGLLNEVVAATELDAAIDRWIGQVLECSPVALRAIKAHVRRTADLPLAAARRTHVQEVADALDSADAEEGIRAFRAKRKPSWEES